MPGDDYGVFGTSGDEDEYGVFGAPKPRRSRRPAARDIEAPESKKEEARAEEEEVFGRPTLAETRGEPAGPPAPTPLRGDRQAPDPSLLRELARSGLSFAHGASLNTMDELAGAGTWLSHKMGMSDDGRPLREIAADYDKRLRGASSDYPVGHGAGRVTAGALLGLAGPASAVGQAAVAGGAGALNRYADDRNPWWALGEGAIDAATAGVGTAGANKIARMFARSPDAARRAALEAAAQEGLAKHGPQLPERVHPRLPAPPTPIPDEVPVDLGTPRPQPSPVGPVYDPLAAQTRPVVPESGPPRPLPNGGPAQPYDPLAAQTRPQLAETPRPQMNPAEMAYPYDALEAGRGARAPTPELEALPEATAAEAKDPVVRTALEMFQPTLATRGTVEQLDDWMRQVIKHDLPPQAERALLGAWAKRMQDVSPDVDAGRLLAEARLGNEFAAQKPRYKLGDLDVPSSAPPRPRLAERAGAEPRYSIGGVEAPADALPRPRVGGEPAEKSPMLQYLLGDTPLPQDALPRPRVGGPAVLGEPPASVSPSQPSAPFTPGEIDMTPPSKTGEWIGDFAPERELKRLAQSRVPEKGVAEKVLGLARYAPGPMGRGARILNAAGAAGRNSGGDLRGLVVNEQLGRGLRGLDSAGNAIADSYQRDVHGQDREPVAYGDRNTLNYALSAALHGGDTGLSQEDEATLTKAVVAGDQDAINAADFRLRQRYPAYARRIERELRALNEEE